MAKSPGTVRAALLSSMRMYAYAGTLAIAVGLSSGAIVPVASVSAPTITAKPANPTSSTTATFAFLGSAGATFQCKLDAGAYATCTSPKGYWGLAPGSHTFSVRAVAGFNVSTPATHTWTIDTTPPPVPVITSGPANPSNTRDPSFSFTVAEAGAGFHCKLDAAAWQQCTSPKRYGNLAEGSHTFLLRSADAAGNVSPPVSRTWVVDTIAPPAPVFTLTPPNPSSNATNEFAWVDAEPGVTFGCSAENGPWGTCASPYRYVVDTDMNGQHQFAVRAVDAAGNVSATTSYRYKYDKLLPDEGVPFLVTGNVAGITLGVWNPIVLTVTNPNAATIYVTSITVTVSPDSTPPGCPSAPNVEVQQSSASVSSPLVVPAGGTVTLPAGGVSNPLIRIRNLPDVNQDVCKDKTFGLTYSGTANN